jgi:AraC family transcriptional regulator
MRPDTRVSYEDRIQRAQIYLGERLDTELHLDEVASVACLSPFHFHRIFRGMTGETVAGYVRRLRLQRAATQLRTGGESVTQVALGAGYESLEGFSRAFHEHFGCAPSEWRETRAPKRASYEPREVRVVHLPATPMIALRHVGPYDTIGPVFAKVFQWAGRNGVLRPPYHTVGIPHDDPEVTPPERIRCDAALLLSVNPPETREVRSVILPPRDYAVARLVGPYDRLSDVYAWLCGEWLPRSGREAAAAPPLEFYRNSPHDTPREELITDIHLALEGEE